MERIHQMYVVPDVLPELRPSVDLHVTATAVPQEIRLRNTTDKQVEPGLFLLPKQVNSMIYISTSSDMALRLCNRLNYMPTYSTQIRDSIRCSLWIQVRTPCLISSIASANLRLKTFLTKKTLPLLHICTG